MNYWLFKSEPETWGWHHQVARGAKGQYWDGVRNYQARNNMRLMQIGDLGFFYHSVKEKRIMGIVEVIKTAYHDPTTEDERWDVVDIKAVRELPVKVTLEEIKANPTLSGMVLVNNSRLSVQPVTGAEWNEIRQMGADFNP